MELITKASRSILIFGVFLIISCIALHPSINGLLMRFDSSLKGTEMTPPPVDPCFVPVNHTLPAGLHCVLKRAAMEDSTVIITVINYAWAKPGSLLDLFFAGFYVGEGVRHLLKHLMIVAMDEKAYKLCTEVHPHCYLWTMGGKNFEEEKKFMTPDYLDMLWWRLHLLRTVLELGYSFVFTDTDILWLRDPFPHLRKSTTADIVIACDHFFGDPNSLGNGVNGGFQYAKSNNRTILFYRYWHGSRDRYSGPNEHEQHAFNMIKGDRYVRELGVKFYHLDTNVFSGFCEHGKDLSSVCTMHANCCGGIENKLHDLKVALEDWGNFTTTAAKGGNTSAIAWRIPKHC